MFILRTLGNGHSIRYQSMPPLSAGPMTTHVGTSSLSKQRNRTQTTPSTLQGTSPNVLGGNYLVSWPLATRSGDSTLNQTVTGHVFMFICLFSGNDKRPESRGFKKLSEFGNSSLQGHGSSQNTCFILFRCNQRGADDP